MAGNLEPLSTLDAAFLHREDARNQMHIGVLALFEGEPPAYDDLLEHIRRSLHLAPRYRQRPAAPPWQSGRPVWIEDPRFNLSYHLRHTALPPPGGEEELLRLCGRVFSQQLDRTKPLWEIWLVEGLSGGRFALLAKTHAALVDDVAGIDLMTVLFDTEADAPPRPEPPRWTARPEPHTAELVARGLQGFVESGLSLAQLAVARPGKVAGRIREAAGGLADLALSAVSNAPPGPLDVRVGPHRRYATATASLEDFRLVREAFGGTVNDVVLTVVAGALATFLRSRGVKTEGLRPRANVPISVRTSEDDPLDTGFMSVVAPLPVAVRDPVERLRMIGEALDGLKDSRLAIGAEAISRMEDFAPPTILARSSRLRRSKRFYQLLVTNIPGPQEPRYLLGRRMAAVHPVPSLGGDRALAVALMSYDGRMHFGLLGDYDGLPDIGTFTAGLQDALAELVRLARRQKGGTIRAQARAKRQATRTRARKAER